MSNAIKVNFQETRYTRWPCALCGGTTEKRSIRSTFQDEDGTTYTVCEHCLEAGVGKIRERIGEYVAGLEGWIKFLRTIAKQDWELPTIQDFIKAESDREHEFVKHLTKEERKELEDWPSGA